MTPVFVDAQALIAYACLGDALHDSTRRWVAQLKRDRRQLVTSNFVLAEALNLINGRLGRHDIAVKLGSAVLETSFIRLLRVSRELERKAWAIFRKHDDKLYSYTDCTSFAMMEDMGTREALTHDHHFQQHGFRALLRE